MNPSLYIAIYISNIFHFSFYFYFNNFVTTHEFNKNASLLSMVGLKKNYFIYIKGFIMLYTKYKSITFIASFLGANLKNQKIKE